MRLKTSVGFSAPLMAAAILAGCATEIVETTFATAPKITAVYAVDDHPTRARNTSPFFVPLAPVALFALGDTRVNAKAPASYDAFRIEFDQPVKPEEVANLNTLAGGAEGQTFCTETGNIQFIDVTDSNRAIPSSICYNPATPLGAGPHVTIHVGLSTLDSTKKAFTCQRFTGSDFGLKANNQYAIKLTIANLKGTNGKPVESPSGGGWASGVFSFQTAGLEILAVGYQDPESGFFTWQQKPAGKGFFRFLDPAASFLMIPTNDAIQVVTSLATLTDDFNNEDGVVIDASGNPVVSVKRKKDGAVIDSLALGWDYDFYYRVIAIWPPMRFSGAELASGNTGTWDPNTEYEVTIGAGLADYDETTTLGTALTFSFKTADAPLGPVNSGPTSNGTAISSTTIPFVTVQTSVDSTTVTADNVKLVDASGTSVVGAPALRAGTNGQVVRFVPSSGVRLKPETRYTFSIANLKAAATAGGGDLAGKPIASYTKNFTTAAFTIGVLSNSTLTPAGAATNIDRSITQSPSLAVNDKLQVIFNDAATGVDTSSVKLFEVAGSGTTTEVPSTITKVSGSTYTVKASDANYILKFGQRYQVKLLQTITDPNGVKLKSEGCTVTDCSDARSFVTNRLAPTITPNVTTGSFNVDWNFAYDFNSVKDQLPTAATDRTKAVRFYSQDATGKLTPLGATCTVPTADATRITCQASDALVPNSSYLISVVFTKDAPAKVTAKIGGFNTDTVSGIFAGSRTATFKSACPP